MTIRDKMFQKAEEVGMDFKKVIDMIADKTLHAIANKKPNAITIPIADMLWKVKNKGVASKYLAGFFLHMQKKKCFERVDFDDKSLTFIFKNVDLNVIKREYSRMHIKDAKIDNESFLVNITDINGKDRIISFKSSRGKTGREKEKKAFKILFCLWDFKRVVKDKKVLEKGSYVSFDSLKQYSGCDTLGAVYQHIRRICKRFANNEVPIEIECLEGKCRLIIRK